MLLSMERALPRADQGKNKRSRFGPCFFARLLEGSRGPYMSTYEHMCTSMYECLQSVSGCQITVALIVIGQMSGPEGSDFCSVIEPGLGIGCTSTQSIFSLTVDFSCIGA